MGIKLNFDQALLKWQARHGERMTYAELAKRCRISEPTIYRLKAGQPTKLDLDKLNRICKVLECDPGDLLERIDTSKFVDPQQAEWQMQQRADDLKTIKWHVTSKEEQENEHESIENKTEDENPKT